MEAFIQHTGIVAPLMRSNIDTDSIIPSREMKRVSREGLGAGLFAGWRYLEADNRDPEPGFVLNRPAYRDASILATGPNFGCGSSREHAVWALYEFGFRAILAPSYGAIFERNCYNNGLLPVSVDADTLGEIAQWVESDPAAHRLTIDLEHKRLIAGDWLDSAFHVPVLQQQMLLNGWDPIDLTLRHAHDIRRFELRDRVSRPWAYASGPGSQ